MIVLIIHIKQLVNVRDTWEILRGKALSELPFIDDAFLLIEDDIITAYGNMFELELKVPILPKNIIDATGQYVLPAWCDSHTHIVFPASREDEFRYKLQGKTYSEIAAMGGGILNSANKLNNTSEEDLYVSAKTRLDELAAQGTGAIEIKSGYGLSVEGELKMLRVIKRLKETSPVLIRSTFLGAHTFPMEYRDDHAGYIDLIINRMIPVIASEKLADYIDVFCETGFFSVEEMEKICEAGIAAGLKPKLHVNQLNSLGGIQKAIELEALSVDHLEVMTDADIRSLAASSVIGTLLPTAAFFLRMNYQPARMLIDSGCAIALASDYNPGSSPGGNMNFVNTISCIQMRMLPEEVINASTINGAFAMELQESAGSISIGKKANLIFTKPVPSVTYLFYAFGSDHIDKVMLNGEFI